MDDKKMIDMNEVFEITGGSKELFDQMIEVFTEIAPDQINRIQEAFKEGDYNELTAAAHDVKSSSTSIGAGILFQSALKLEQSSKKKLELPIIMPMINEVEDNIKLTLDFSKNCQWPEAK